MVTGKNKGYFKQHAPVNSMKYNDNDIILKAFIKSKEIRPQRLTILDKISKKEIEEAALTTGVIC